MTDHTNIDPIVTVFSGGRRFLVGRSAERSDSHPNLGIALFDPDDDVEIAFEYDPASGRVRASNQTF